MIDQNLGLIVKDVKKKKKTEMVMVYNWNKYMLSYKNKID